MSWADALQGGAQGAATGSAGGPWGSIGLGLAGLAGGLLGGKPQLPPELKRLFRFQMSTADSIRRYAQGVPLSDPQEQAALAQQHGLLGEQQFNDRQNLYANLNMNQGNANTPNLLNNITNQQTGQRMTVDMQHLLAALSSRREALGQASQAASGALGAASGQRQDPGAGIPEMFGQIGQMLAYNQANRPQTQGTGVGSGGVRSGYQMGAYGQQPAGGFGGPGLTPGLLGTQPVPGNLPVQGGYGQGQYGQQWNPSPFPAY